MKTKTFQIIQVDSITGEVEKVENIRTNKITVLKDRLRELQSGYAVDEKVVVTQESVKSGHSYYNCLVASCNVDYKYLIVLNRINNSK